MADHWTSYDDFLNDHNMLCEFGEDSKRDNEIICDVGNLMDDSNDGYPDEEDRQLTKAVLSTEEPELMNAKDLDKITEEIQTLKPSNTYSDEDFEEYFRSVSARNGASAKASTSSTKTSTSCTKKNEASAKPKYSKESPSNYHPTFEFRPSKDVWTPPQESWKPLGAQEEFMVKKDEFPPL